MSVRRHLQSALATLLCLSATAVTATAGPNATTARPNATAPANAPTVPNATALPNAAAGTNAAASTNAPAGPEVVSIERRPLVRLTVTDGNDIRFARITRTQGLSQTRVDKLVQDDLGFIWFGTQYGLNRYDGYRF